MAPENPFRLPRTLIPQRYELDLVPELVAESFSGTVRIHGALEIPTPTIELHAVELTIENAQVIDGAGTTHAARHGLGEDDRLILHFDDNVPAGDCVLEIAFSGPLSEKLAGFYRSTFRDEEGNEQLIATTQFEPTDARRAFPCFDEPDLKASFEITLTVDESLFAVSNAREVSVTHDGNGKKTVKFAPTMAMSTYLVAFVIGPLVATETVDVDGTPLRVICRPGRERLASFALEAGAAALRYFTSYFGIPYPGDKLDLIGIPDFNFGAMENLGCVTFRETALLVDTDHASRLEKERVADVVGHEIAHMWFGDLVTMKWWNGIWLNEAFATFMELMFCDNFRPEWKRWTSFGISRAYALSTDGLASTRTIEYPVLHPREAEGMFDVAITYQKGGAVVRMLEQYLEPGEFQRGIAHYLETHKYGNTETTDLWDAIESATGEPVRAVMDSWIFQEGHPVVSVTRDESGTKLTLRQNRFLYLGARGAETKWHVPIRLRVQINGEVEHRKVLLTDETMTIDFGAKVDWVVVNSGSWGFYRVRYEGELLRALTTDLSHLSSLERFTLLSDSWATVLSGGAPLQDYVELAQLMTDQDDPDVWAALISPFEAMKRVASDDDVALVAQHVRDIAGPTLERLGWSAQPGESERVNTTRAQLLSALALTGNDTAIQQRCVALIDQELGGEEVIEPDLLQTVINIAAYVGDSARFEQFCERAANAATPQEEIRFLRALGRFNNRELVQNVVEYALSDAVRPQDGMFLLAPCLSNGAFGQYAWELVKQRWAELDKKFASSSMARSVEALSDQYITGLAADVRTFIQEHPLEHSEKLIAQTIEHLEVNAAFANRTKDSIRSALAK